MIRKIYVNRHYKIEDDDMTNLKRKEKLLLQYVYMYLSIFLITVWQYLISIILG